MLSDREVAAATAILRHQVRGSSKRAHEFRRRPPLMLREVSSSTFERARRGSHIAHRARGSLGAETIGVTPSCASVYRIHHLYGILASFTALPLTEKVFASGSAALPITSASTGLTPVRVPRLDTATMVPEALSGHPPEYPEPRKQLTKRCVSKYLWREAKWNDFVCMFAPLTPPPNREVDNILVWLNG